MDATLRWHGGLPDVQALERLLAAGARVSLAYAEDPVVPEFLFQEQAAALGLEARRDEHAALRLAEPPLEAPGPWRAFVCACAPALTADHLGRFVDEAFLAELPANARFRTFVVEGKRFARRVEVMADDILPLDDGWRLGLGLRGC